MESSKAYEIIKKLEDVVRKLIADELSQISKDWWEKRIPEKVRKKAEKRKQDSETGVFPRGQEHPKISYVDFSDYEKIITNPENWNDIFKQIFGDEVSVAGKFRDLRSIRNDISHSRELSKKDGERLQFIIQEIEAAIEYYYKKKKPKAIKQNQLKFKQEFTQHVITLSVSPDRTVYPEKSIIHIRSLLNDIIQDKPIIFEIYNSKDELILEKQLDPRTYDNLELKTNGIYQISFDSSEINSKAGESYYVKARHGKATATKGWYVDKREPVLQTNKSIYMINSDMIVTVIDPDSDKDSQAVDYVGDREDSKLIIESRFGKIDGYKLRETGDSTSIFQGVIGILGIGEDGSVIERKMEKQTINKIQGSSIDDGFIGGSPSDEIKLTYKSNSGTASLSVFVANFGATVELDQRVYKPTDKVYITIVAPDLNYDSNMINEIGNDAYSVIQIRTSKDKLLNYKLVETGTDTGIFTGEVNLTESLEKSSKLKTNDLGPTEGWVACDKDDFIEVSLSYFGQKEIVGRALIKS